MPTTTPATAKGNRVQEVDASAANQASVTPVPQPRRVIKLGPKKKSPYVRNEKNPTVPKSDSKLYDKVCTYGGRSKDLLNDGKIIDYGYNYIYLHDLANSVRPRQ
jgi:hypothetical protein